MGFIYKITSPTGKIYIGQTVDIDDRFTRYRQLRCKGQTKLYRSIKKYGHELHSFEMIESCLDIDMNNRERHYQEFYDVLGKNGLNCCYVQSSFNSGRHSEESIAKMKISQSNRSAETRARLSKSRMGHHVSDATKAKISEKLIGRKLPKETCEKMGKSRLGRKMSEKNRLALIEMNTGRVVSQDTRDKIATAASNISDETRKKMSDAKKGKPSHKKGVKLTESQLDSYRRKRFPERYI